jgi:predicted CXXCH cytochrome family protein
MKSLITLLLVAGSVSLSAGISATKHNLSSTSTNTVKSTNVQQICVFCHTPHSGASQTIPLWNKTTISTAAYTAYGTTSKGTNVAVPTTGNSLACFTCHDGTASVGAMVNIPNSDMTGATAIFTAVANRVDATGLLTGTNSALLGKDMRNDHPVNVTYPVTTDYTPSASLTSVVLFAGKVECASCHDVHSSAVPAFLRASNTDSALCLKCHIK